MLNAVTADFETALREMLPAAAFPDPAHYMTEPRGRWHGHGFVVAPATTQEVSLVVKACADAKIGIVPYGGGTGLVGGQIASDGPLPVILSLARMNTLRQTYPLENMLICDAGVILADVQQAAENMNRLFPLSLASEGSARIGGLLATNAGGVNVLRYGNARAQCLGLEVVLADGTIWHGLSRLRKDNTGYDLRNLMIGSEGSLGIITGAALRLMPRPAQTGTAIICVRDPQAALEMMALTGDMVGDGISAFELIHKQGFDFLADVGPACQPLFDTAPEWCVLVELGLSTDPEAALLTLFECALDKGLATDGIIAQSQAQRDALWFIRENIPEANRRIGSVSSHDISLPLGVVPEFIARAAPALAAIGAFRINCFGHLGDGNLHYNVFPPKGQSRADCEHLRNAVKTCIYDLVHTCGGSVSAEHGIGRLKVDELTKYADPAKLMMMACIKQALDPQGIMNPGAVLRPSQN